MQLSSCPLFLALLPLWLFLTAINLSGLVISISLPLHPLAKADRAVEFSLPAPFTSQHSVPQSGAALGHQPPAAPRGRGGRELSTGGRCWKSLETRISQARARGSVSDGKGTLIQPSGDWEKSFGASFRNAALKLCVGSCYSRQRFILRQHAWKYSFFLACG